MDNLVIIDGHHLLFRMFYGMQSRIRSREGKLINALLGFVSSTLKYIRMFDASHIVVVFDSEQATFRNELSPEYKATRDVDYSLAQDDDNPFAQYPMIIDTLNHLDIANFESVGYEADDTIASYVAMYSDVNKVIVSGDSDLLQLVDDMTTVYMDRGKLSITYTPSAVRDKFGVDPLQIVDIKCLAGDKTDNVKGIAGVGNKTAVKLVSAFGSVDNIIMNIENIMPLSLQTKVASNIELIRHNVKMITVNRAVPLPLQLDQLTVGQHLVDLRAIDILRSMGYLER